MRPSPVRFGEVLLLHLILVLFTSFAAATAAEQSEGQSVVFNSTHFYEYGGDPHAVAIEVTVHDNYQGNHSRYQWGYTVTNYSYDPNCPLFPSNGFSGFILYLDPGLVFEIGNIESPTPEWVIGAQYSLPINWDIIEGEGVVPLTSGAFSYTTDPRTPVGTEGYFNTRCFGVRGQHYCRNEVPGI